MSIEQVKYLDDNLLILVIFMDKLGFDLVGFDLVSDNN